VLLFTRSARVLSYSLPTTPRPPTPPLFPYPTLFRSQPHAVCALTRATRRLRLDGHALYVGLLVDLARQKHRTHRAHRGGGRGARSEEHTSELQSRENLVCRLLLEKKKGNEILRTCHV